MTTVMLSDSDFQHIVYLAGCTLARKPGKNNWVEEDAVGGLPEYICRIARAINRDDPSKSISSVIAIAVGRVKTWARGGGGVNADTRAKAAKAVAEWEAKKKAAKLNNKKMKLSAGNEITLFLAKSYNIEDVRRQYKALNPGGNRNYVWVREVWNNFLIVTKESYPNGDMEMAVTNTVKVPYTVDKDGTATFGEEKEVKQAYVELSAPELQTSMTDAQLEKASHIPCTYKDRGSLSEMVRLASQPDRNEYILKLAALEGKSNLVALLSNR